ncbi:ribosome hibernation-promoting factor, HPF/YfiA family [Myceligenerans pegani]|uniref:Ribosome hibernation promoting factor n=1 Tax=Myceligenerans pegani TaxID=2776917 RepID=A0ABR9MY79_9MICO|nr:ribosome-associated translation inhibitor RaiA [Myceligenerans sp. TRM 65318]MBE1876344.1 ribosome-associated translation inhibitor RaiA [Myceligenerans sp. TRM 65318]MBE3018615.1 ribosome-associated translation inhibitor RaiA [Myceligenerans sp. TRM 65318]
MEIVVVGRHTVVADKFRQQVEDKLSKVELLSPTARRVDVEVTHENNPRMAEQRERVELTVRAKGPVIRAEAAADDRFGALDLAIDKLNERLRRARDRRKHHRNHKPNSHTTTPRPLDDDILTPRDRPEPQVAAPAALAEPGDSVETTMGDSPVVIRQKLHHAEPMTLDDAVYEMEMVGHDFYLFIDKETARPSVLYKRQGWTFGVIQLDEACIG